MDKARRSSARAGDVYAAALIASAGAVDAVGFLHLHTFYASFMSGNTTRIGIAIAQGDVALAGSGFAIVVAFVAGVVAGDMAITAARRRDGWTLGAEAVLVLAAAAVPGGLWPLVALASAMGMHNALIHRLDGANVALTYVTGTLVQIGKGLASVLRRTERTPTSPYALAWLALLVGTIAGGWMFITLGKAALLPLGAVLAMLSAIAFGKR